MPYGRTATVGRNGSERAARFANDFDGKEAQRQLRGFKPVYSDVIDNVQVWWLETGSAGRQRTDLRLYSRPVDNQLSDPYVECSSCHDPHTDNDMFLRTDATTMPLCLACHDI